MKNRMKDKWFGVTYIGVLPEWMQNVKWIYSFWKKYMCSKGFHLFDEVQSLESHYLYCDACELEIHIAE